MSRHTITLCQPVAIRYPQLHCTSGKRQFSRAGWGCLQAQGEDGVSTMTDTSLLGREEEISRLTELVAPPYPHSRKLLLLGDPGMGKTVLLAEAAREATLAGVRVLAVTGRESEQDLAFAGLHQLLRSVLDRVSGLPARQAEAL